MTNERQTTYLRRGVPSSRPPTPSMCLCLESKKRNFRSSASYFVRLSLAPGLGPGISVNSKKRRQSTSYLCKGGATDTDDKHALSIHYHDCFEEVKEEVVLKTTTQLRSERIMAWHVFSPRGLDPSTKNNVPCIYILITTRAGQVLWSRTTIMSNCSTT